MISSCKLFIFFFWFLLISSVSQAAPVRLSGSVTDKHGDPVPFASVYLEGSSRGTTTNLDGNYVLDLEPGNYRIVFRFIGFKQRVEPIMLGNESLILDVILAPESYQLAEVKIVASAEDPAYSIIRKAQKKRKSYLREVKEYRCKSYVKSTQKLESFPNKIFGQKVELDQVLDTVTRIFYLSESVSNFSFRQPDNIKEEMISSSLSGNPNGYSFNQTSDLLLDFYENLIQIEGLTPRGIVTPISANALFYYDFRLEGTFVENGYTVNKIHVIPKRKNDPVFTGDIFILDDSWRIHSLDLLITKAQQLQFIDTFRIKQSLLPVENDRWMLFNTQYAYHFSVLGFNGNGIVLGIFSQYDLKPDFPAGYFNGQVLKVNKESNTKDSSYWKANRPVPLTLDESTDYHRKDSTRVIHESKAYKDSMDALDNKLSISDLLLGYTYTDTYHQKEYSYSSLLESINFNTVEGWNASLDLSYTKKWNEPEIKSLRISPSLRYGFSNSHLNGKVYTEYRYDRHRNSILKAEGGSDVVQFNAANPISPLVNSLYSLLARKNFMKLYEKIYGKIGYDSELTNGIRGGLNAEYAERNPLINTTSDAFASTGDRKYTSNDPIHPESEAGHFIRNESLTLEGDLRIRFRQEYVDRPEAKQILGSKYPELRIFYRKGFPLLKADTDYDLIKASISHQHRLGLLGRFRYQVTLGDFLGNEKLYFMDAHHFNGNKTWFTSFQPDDFRNLDYYTWSTTGTFLEGHAEQNFGGFLLNKIPLIRKLKLNEVAGVHYFHTPEAGHYAEFTLGVEKLNFIRFEFYASFPDGKRSSWGAVFGIRRSIGTQ